MHTRRQWLAVVGGSSMLAGCSSSTSAIETDSRVRTDGGSPIAPAADAELGYTHLRATGNRLVGGTGELPDRSPVDVEVDGTPTWVVGIPERTASRWVIVTDDGHARAVRVADGSARIEDESFPDLPQEMPPLLEGTHFALVRGPTSDASTHTHPVPVQGGLLFVTDSGALVRWDASEAAVVDRLELDALPDARIVLDGSLAFVLADATASYDHAVLGDGAEAGSVAVVSLADGLAVERHIEPEDEAVIEGLSPLLADVTGDGAREVVVTVTDADRGARIVVYRPDGTLVATGPAIGRGFAWRHQLAVAPFGGDGRPEIAAVKMPHVEKTMEFYRLDGDELTIVAREDGFSTHTIGSRNLDTAVAGDLDGDGRLELLAPTATRNRLAAVRRTTDGAETVWQHPLAGTLETNVCAVPHAEGITVAAGTDDYVRFWPA